ncbi:hypothetical protein ACM0P6_02950 [Komagataeibacter sucrofermentans]|uniref:Uncharacterized protein n=1 Tax=Komagataeibacter sucrofermentans TaxID=1053551 RepID=A0A318QPU5_9PROT|nr:hypothetical protein [Komagataeibacter sucrofermentans]PYD79964.1 hypothetical protein CFR77_05490 [Komagataeibacter sucrofermentans]GBQ52198.1 hypothetical protein AA15973_2691 [Komagataeibacter sucrofermentans DSM 15973]
MNATRVIDVQAVWFTEAATGGNALNLRCPTEGTPQAFWADIALDRPRRMRFEQVVWLDGCSIYRATESRPDVCWIAAQDEPLVKLRMMPARDGGSHEDPLSSDRDAVRRQIETGTVVFPGNQGEATGGSPVSADYINRMQDEIMQMISGDCASRHRQSVPERVRFRAMHVWAVCLLLPAGAALLLHAKGRHSSRKSR